MEEDEMVNTVRYTGETTRGLSPALWGDGAKLVADQFMGKCAFLYDDFITPPYASQTDAAAQFGPYYIWGATGAVVGGGAANDLSEGELGVLSLYHDNTDEDEIWFAINGGPTTNTGQFQINNNAGYQYKVIYECRLKVDVITADVNCIFAGLMDPSNCGNNGKADNTAVIADKSFIGFDGLQAAPQTLTFSYKNGGGAAQTDQTGATLVADTWIKLGFVFDPSRETAKRIAVYVDGVETGIYVTGAIIDAATFPEGDNLAPVFGVKNTVGTAGTLSVDWVAVAQYADDAG